MVWRVFRLVLVGFVVVMGVLLWNCEEEVFEREYAASTHNSSESHNWGYNCMECHRRGGPGEGWYTVAGSVADTSLRHPLGNVTIELWEEVGVGEPVAVIEVDALGNFYTTEPIDWKLGLVPVVVSSDGQKRLVMPFATRNGACNSCHFTNWAPPIWSFP